LFQIISFEKYFYVSLGNIFLLFCGGLPSCGGPGQLPSLPSLKSGSDAAKCCSCLRHVKSGGVNCIRNDSILQSIEKKLKLYTLRIIWRQIGLTRLLTAPKLGIISYIWQIAHTVEYSHRPSSIVADLIHIAWRDKTRQCCVGSDSVGVGSLCILVILSKAMGNLDDGVCLYFGSHYWDVLEVNTTCTTGLTLSSVWRPHRPTRDATIVGLLCFYSTTERSANWSFFAKCVCDMVMHDATIRDLSCKVYNAARALARPRIARQVA